MSTPLIDQLLKCHASSASDFRWSNLRKLVMKSVKGREILDAGCGTGHLTLELLREGYSVTAVDFSQELVDFTRKIVGERNLFAEIFRVNLEEGEGLKADKYDTIICLDVLEHIRNDQIALQNLVHSLKMDGTLIISVPAVSWLFGFRDRAVGHYRRYDKSDVVGMLADANLEVISLRYWNFIGLVASLIAEKVFRQRLNEDFRYDRSSGYRVFMNRLLGAWFTLIENPVPMPIGLSLIVICRRNPEAESMPGKVKGIQQSPGDHEPVIPALPIPFSFHSGRMLFSRPEKPFLASGARKRCLQWNGLSHADLLLL